PPTYHLCTTRVLFTLHHTVRLQTTVLTVVLVEGICTMCGMFMFPHLPFAKLCRKSIVFRGTFFSSCSFLDVATALTPTDGAKCACASSSRIIARSRSSSCFCLSCCKIASTKNVVREP